MIEARGLQPHQFGMLWLDVEGFEIEAIAGMASLVSRQIPLCVEFNAQDYGPSESRKFYDHLSSHYEQVALVSDESIRFRPVAELELPIKQTDLLFI
jgi:hypothetical protein